MGWDIQTLGKHNLDISSISSLAKELAEKLDINIKYGYYQDYTIDVTKKRISENISIKGNFILLGKIKTNSSDYYYQLNDCFYQFKEVRNLIGDYDISSYKWKKKNFKIYNAKKGFLENFNKSLNKELYQLTLIDNKHFKRKENIKFQNLDITKEIVDINIDFPYRWFGFAQTFTKANVWDKEFKIINEIRNNLKNYYNRLGCTKIIIYPDQGPAQLITDYKYNGENWNSILSYVKEKKYYLDLIALCSIKGYDEIDKKLYQKQYNEKDMQLQLDIPTFFKKKQKLYPAYTEIEIFYNDFSDLK